MWENYELETRSASSMKLKLKAKKAKEHNLIDLLKTYHKEVQPAGRQVPMEGRMYRVKVVEQFLKATQKDRFSA